MAYYKDFREYLKALEQKGKLTHIKREINKDTQLHPLVRLEFRVFPKKSAQHFYSKMLLTAGGTNMKARWR